MIGKREEEADVTHTIAFNESQSDVNRADGEVLKILKKHQQKPNTTIIISS